MMTFLVRLAILFCLDFEGKVSMLARVSTMTGKNLEPRIGWRTFLLGWVVINLGTKSSSLKITQG